LGQPAQLHRRHAQAARPKVTASRKLRFAAHGIGELVGMGEADSYFD
jgi:hypothetical protein